MEIFFGFFDSLIVFIMFLWLFLIEISLYIVFSVGWLKDVMSFVLIFYLLILVFCVFKFRMLYLLRLFEVKIFILW